MDSWFFLSFPATWILVAGPEGDEERSGEEVLRLIQIRLTTSSLAKNTLACQVNSPQRTGRTHNETLSAVAMRVSKRSRPWPTTSNADS